VLLLPYLTAALHHDQQELGIDESVAAIHQLSAKPAAPPRQKRQQVDAANLEPTRRSSRPRTEINYAQILADAERAPREPVDYTERIKLLQLDAEAAEKLRLEMAARRSGSGDKVRGDSKSRGPKDSGKGVRVQVRVRVVVWHARMACLRRGIPRRAEACACCLLRFDRALKLTTGCARSHDTPPRPLSPTRVDASTTPPLA